MGDVERITLFPSPACRIQGREKGAMIMPHPLFETIITSLVSPETAFEWKLLHCFWRMLADTGTPVSPDALAQALHCPREQVLETLRLYPEAEYDPAGNLAGLGFTLHQTPHQLLLGERTFSGWCARCPGLSCCARMPCAHCLHLSSHRNGHPAYRQRGPH